MISLVIMATVSLAWVVAVDLTPAGNRPYVGSSTNNTEIEPIVGHNGLERLTGRSEVVHTGGSGLNFLPNNSHLLFNSNHSGQSNGTSSSPAAPHTLNPGTRGTSGTGTAGKTMCIIPASPVMKSRYAGVARLWSSGLYGQASWLIIFAFFCIVAKIKKVDRKNFYRKTAGFRIVWLLTMCIFFSFAGFVSPLLSLYAGAGDCRSRGAGFRGDGG